LINSGEAVEINGSGFVSGVKVAFGGVDAAVSAALAAKITVTTPPHPAGQSPYNVKNPMVLRSGF
jgi:IPT/TIG domain